MGTSSTFDAAVACLAASSDRPAELDWSVLERLAELEDPAAPGFVAEVVAIFLDESSRLARDIRAAAASGDFRELRRCAHALKGCASDVGADGLSRDAGALELMASQGRLDGSGALVSALEAEQRRLRRDLGSIGAPARR